MFRIQRVSITGFRGFTDEQSLEFNRPFSVLIGNNRQGKSSALNAIEWCLFGEACYGRETGIRERVGWEVLNRIGSREANIAIELVNQDGNYRVTRGRGRGGPRRRSSVQVMFPDGSTIEGDEAEAVITVLFRSSFQNFMATVYQHQEAVRSLIIQEPRYRNDAIDRLLGLSEYREILRGISGAKINTVASEIDSAVKSLNDAVKQLLHTRDRDAHDKRQHAQTQGIPEGDITTQGILDRALTVQQEMKVLAMELGVENSQTSVPQTWKDISQFVSDARQNLSSIWAKAPVVSEQDAIISRLNKLKQGAEQYVAHAEAVGKAKALLQEALKASGDEGELEEKSKQISLKIEQLNHDLRETNSRASLVNEGIKYLREAAPSGQNARCPLCATTVPDLLEHLEREWRETFEARAGTLGSQIKEQEIALAETNSGQDELRNLRLSLNRANSRLDTSKTEIATLLGRQIAEDEDPHALINHESNQTEDQLKSISAIIGERRKRLTELEERLTLLNLIYEIIDIEEKKDVAERIQTTSQYQKIEEIQEQTSQVESDLEHLRFAIQQSLQEEAIAKVSQAADSVNTYFQQMTAHPGIKLDVVSDNRTGGNDYRFLDLGERDLTPVLSQGDMNCLALAIFLGLARAATDSHQFEFLMLDDPSQSLGTVSKQQLTKVLAELAGDKQLIVSTMDQEFYEFLTKTITQTKRIYRFEDWDSIHGPTITRIE